MSSDKGKHDPPVRDASPQPEPKLVPVVCAIDVFHKGKMYRKGDKLEVNAEDAKADCYKTAAKLKEHDELIAERDAQAAAESAAFMARARASGELRRKSELIRAQVAEELLKKQAARAAEATKAAAGG